MGRRQHVQPTALITMLVATVLLIPLLGGDLPAATPASSDEELLPASRALEGELFFQSPDLAIPSEVVVAGSRLVVADNYAESPIRVIRRDSGTQERAFGRSGQGPREFEGIFSLDVIEATNELLVNDPVMQRLTWIDLEGDFQDGEWVGDRTTRVQAPAAVLLAEWGPEGIVGVGTFTNGRLAHLTHAGVHARTTGDLPVQPAEVSPSVWSQTTEVRLESNPSRTRFAVASRFADRLEIYDRAGALVAMGERPYGFEPQNLDVVPRDHARFGYIALTATEDRIYALFSGRLRADGDANFGDRIHVFDWEGQLLDVWSLDSRLFDVAITPEADQLYGIRHEPMPAVVRYSLE